MVIQGVRHCIQAPGLPSPDVSTAAKFNISGWPVAIGVRLSLMLCLALSALHDRKNIGWNKKTQVQQAAGVFGGGGVHTRAGTTPCTAHSADVIGSVNNIRALPM
jgi:hypothetical protein